MGIKVFRDNHWERIKNGLIGNKDILGLDTDKDELLIHYIILHAPEKVASRCMKKYGIEKVKSFINIDDSNDSLYPEYCVLEEQVFYEDSIEVLKEKAFGKDRMPGAFAFCRLTGYSFVPDACDAYSYRTYACGCIEKMDKEAIKAFCQEMIEKNGPFQKEANNILK